MIFRVAIDFTFQDSLFTLLTWLLLDIKYHNDMLISVLVIGIGKTQKLNFLMYVMLYS